MTKIFIEFYMAACGILTFGFLILGIMWLCSLFTKASSEQKWVGFLLACTYALFPLQGAAMLSQVIGGMSSGSTGRGASASILFLMALIQLAGFLVSFCIWVDARRPDGSRTSFLPFTPFPFTVIFLILAVKAAI